MEDEKDELVTEMVDEEVLDVMERKMVIKMMIEEEEEVVVVVLMAKATKSEVVEMVETEVGGREGRSW